MAFTAQDLADFHRFTEQKISVGGVDNIDQLARQWQELRELAEDIRLAESDIEAGRGQPLDEALTDVHKKLG